MCYPWIYLTADIPFLVIPFLTSFSSRLAMTWMRFVGELEFSHAIGIDRCHSRNPQRFLTSICRSCSSSMLQNSLEHSETATKPLCFNSAAISRLPAPFTAMLSTRAESGLRKYMGMIHRLNTGQIIPAVGLGTFQDPDEQEASVFTALQCGFRHIDTAHK